VLVEDRKLSEGVLLYYKLPGVHWRLMRKCEPSILMKVSLFFCLLAEAAGDCRGAAHFGKNSRGQLMPQQIWAGVVRALSLSGSKQQRDWKPTSVSRK